MLPSAKGNPQVGQGRCPHGQPQLGHAIVVTFRLDERDHAGSVALSSCWKVKPATDGAVPARLSASACFVGVA
jgi:hypothetical protein